MNNYFMEKLKNISEEELLNYANHFRGKCENIPACRVTKEGVLSYNYIPLPITDGPLDRDFIESLSMVISAGLLKENTDFSSVFALSEADRGGGLLLGALQAFTGIKVHMVNWYDEATIEAFKGDFLTADMAPPFAMGSRLKPGLYLPKKLKEKLQQAGAVIIDDVISTGETIFTLKSILDTAKIPLRAVACGAEKVDYKGAEKLREAFPIPILTVAKVKIRRLTEKERELYSSNSNITGMSEVTGRRDVVYYL